MGASLVCLCLLLARVVASTPDNPFDLRTRLEALRWSRTYDALLKQTDKPAAERTLRASFQAWAKIHGRRYQSSAEASRRYGLWLDSLRAVIDHNLGQHWTTSWVELNAFADLTPAQFARQHPDGFLKATPHSAASGPRPPILPLAGLPAVVDWVAVGRVPPVRHQRSSDCWAHAAATAIEAAWLIRGNQTAPATVEESRVSVQQLGDCTHTVGGSTATCLGSLSLADAFEYAHEAGCVPEAAYPYQACQLQTCQAKQVLAVPEEQRLRPAAAPGSRAIPAATNVTALLEAVAQGPVVFVMASESSQFRQYAGGVFAPAAASCGGDPDHVMTIVGYDTTSAPPTWLVQNSYGTRWGMGGRMLVRMDWMGHGVCGMYLHVQAPT